MKGAPVLRRSDIVQLMCRSHPYAETLPRHAPATCGNGMQCVLYAASRAAVGVEWAQPPGAGALCLACVIVHVNERVRAGATVHVPFSVLVEIGEFAPSECLALASDGRVQVDGNFPVAGALRVAYADGRFSVRSAPPRATGNEAIDLAMYTPRASDDPVYQTGSERMHAASAPLALVYTARVPESFMHRPWAEGMRAAIAPLVFFCETAQQWRRVRVSEATGVLAVPGESDDAWEARVRVEWDGHPEKRVWLGALLDAAALGGAGNPMIDDFGPWPGALPDVLRHAAQMSPMETYATPGFAAPGDSDIAFLWYKTGDGAAHRRQLAQMMARHVRAPGGEPLWRVVREALLHMLLGTLPVPREFVGLAARRATLDWWYRVPADAEGGAAWIDENPALATAAAFYVRHANMLFHHGLAAAAERGFWGAFGAFVATIRGPALAGDGDAVAAALHTWINMARNPRRRAAATPQYVLVPGAQPAVDGCHTFYCGRCRHFVHNLMGARMACSGVRRRLTQGRTPRCCCPAGEACVQRRRHGCCCVTRSQVGYDLGRGVFVCMRPRCGATPERVDVGGGILGVPGARPTALIACADCKSLCTYRRANHGNVYRCGCVEREYLAECSVCGRRDPCARVLSVVAGADAQRVLLCRHCAHYEKRMHTKMMSARAIVHRLRVHRAEWRRRRPQGRRFAQLGA